MFNISDYVTFDVTHLLYISTSVWAPQPQVEILIFSIFCAKKLKKQKKFNLLLVNTTLVILAHLQMLYSDWLDQDLFVKIQNMSPPII